MKVLILHQHFKTPATGGAIRSYYLAKALVDRGISTVVITAHNEKYYRKEDLEGIEIHYLPVAYDNKFGFGARGKSFLQFMWRSVRLVARLKGIDVCYAISVPLSVGVAAIRIQQRYGIPFHFEVGDLWPDAPVQMGVVQNYFLKKVLYSLERSVYKKATSIVALSTAIQSAIQSKAPGKLVHLIPNFADTEFYKPEQKDSGLEDKFGVSGKFVVSYTGALGAANGLDYYLECARASQKAGLPVHFLLCGAGARLESLKQSAQRLGLQNFSFIPFQNREGVREILNVTDAAFVCFKNIPILETGSPNKYFDGLSAGKLMIINFGGWIEEEIEGAKCGIALDPMHPTNFLKQIVAFVQDRQLLEEYGKRARKLAEGKYSRKELGERFSKLFL